MSTAVSVMIDFRDRWRDVRDQGSRSSCLACATTDAHEQCRLSAESFSAEFLFYHAGQQMPRQDVNDGLTFEAVAHALREDGQPLESEWPYQMVQPTPWMPPAVTNCWCGDTDDTGLGNIDQIVATVRRGQPIVLGIRLTADFFAPLQDPFVIQASGPGFGGHALLAVGVGEHATVGRVLLVRNSWGPRWGDQGHAWLAAEFLQDKLIGCRHVQPRN